MTIAKQIKLKKLWARLIVIFKWLLTLLILPLENSLSQTPDVVIQVQCRLTHKLIAYCQKFPHDLQVPRVLLAKSTSLEACAR